MCLVLTLFRMNERYPLIVAANRDESRSRASTLPHRWPGEPACWAGRDEVAGGTWLGVNAAGLLCAITNRRGEPTDRSLPSRGLLCSELLRQQSPAAARGRLLATLAAQPRNPFNLLCASPTEAWVATWRGAVLDLPPGVHVISNRGEVDDTSLRVGRRTRRLMAKVPVDRPELEPLFAALGEICADHHGTDPICRLGGARGTVSSSLIALDRRGRIAAYWHADGSPGEAEYRPVALGEPVGSSGGGLGAPS